MAIIDLVNPHSPAVVLHRRNKFASAAGTSHHGSHPHSSSQPIIPNNSRDHASSSGKPGHNQICNLTAQPGGSLSIASARSNSRKRTAPSSDTARGTCSSGSLDQPSNLLSGALFNVSPVGMTHPSVMCEPRQNTTGASADSHQVDKLGPVQHISRPSATKPLQAPQKFVPPELAGGHINLVKVTEDYSGALQAADKRVQHASTDPALAKALAEKAELEQQLKVKTFSFCNCLCSGISITVLLCMSKCCIGVCLYQTVLYAARAQFSYLFCVNPSAATQPPQLCASFSLDSFEVSHSTSSRA